MKSKIIFELGLNHMGNEFDGKKIISSVVNKNIYGVTLQIRERSFYKKFPKFYMRKEFYYEISNIVKKNKKKFGIALCDNNTFNEYKLLKVDFYKVINRGIKDKKLLKNLFKSKVKKIFISLGSSNSKELNENFNFLKKNNLTKLVYVFTKNTSKNYNSKKSYSSINKNTNLGKMEIIKKKFNIPVAFGNHSSDRAIFKESLKFNPPYFFNYIKGPKKLDYPDDLHAIDISTLKNFFMNFK